MSKFFERQLTDMYTQVVQTENWRLRLIPLVASSIAETVLGGTVSPDGEGTLTLHTGAMYGPVSASFELLDQSPGESAGAWEDVVELGARATDSEPLALVGIFSDSVEVDENDTGAAVLEGGQEYRVRIHVRGRDDSGTDELIEPNLPARDHLLIQVWPSVVTEPEVLKMTSAKAKSDDENPEFYSGSGALTLGMGDPDFEALKAQSLRDAGE